MVNSPGYSPVKYAMPKAPTTNVSLAVPGSVRGQAKFRRHGHRSGAAVGDQGNGHHRGTQGAGRLDGRGTDARVHRRAAPR